MALDFPNSPTNNQSFSAGGKTWVYNGTKWVLLSVSLNQAVADGAITTAKIADSAITASKIADGTIVAAEIANNAITTAKILDANVTQAKLGTTLSAVTVTTAANRDTAVASPFTGQLVFLTDTKKIQVWDGTAWLNITLAPPETPTSLSATALSTTSVSVAFTAGGANGSPITNYKYALSTDSGSTYGAFTALDPADITTPITISGLTINTSYYIKLKAVNDMGDSVESAATTVTTMNAVTVDYLVVAGGGGGASYYYGGSGGAGGLRSTVTNTGGGGTLETALSLAFGTNYTVTVGGGGAGGGSARNQDGTAGSNSVFSTITSIGGAAGRAETNSPTSGGCGAGGSAGNGLGNQNGSAGTTNQGFAGGNSNGQGASYGGGGGGGAGAAGGNATGSGTVNQLAGSGGAGVATSITGSSVTYAGGGGGQSYWVNSGANGGVGGGGRGAFANGGSGGGFVVAGSGTANLGGGGGGASSDTYTSTGGSGGSGVVILRYSDAFTITIGAGLTGSESASSGGYKRATITAGSGNVSWT